MVNIIVKTGETRRFPRDIDLKHLTALPEGIALRASGDLDLRSLARLSKGVILRAGRNIDLECLASIPEGVSIEACGNLNLNNLTHIGRCCHLGARKYFVDGTWYTSARALRRAVKAKGASK